jgi:hypothetical protein
MAAPVTNPDPERAGSLLTPDMTASIVTQVVTEIVANIGVPSTLVR